MIREEAQDFGRWLAVDADGSAHVFRKKPVVIAGRWVPDKFPTGCVRACVDAGELPTFEGKLFKRTTTKGKHSWEIQ